MKIVTASVETKEYFRVKNVTAKANNYGIDLLGTSSLLWTVLYFNLSIKSVMLFSSRDACNSVKSFTVCTEAVYSQQWKF